MLWNNSHESWNDYLMRCVAQWRNKDSLSKEAAADMIVSIHNTHGGQEKTGQHFNPSSVTEQNRLKANCMTLDRVIEKDLFNVMPYILAAMSDETKLAFAGQYLAVAGLTVHLSESEEEGGFGVEAACDLQLQLGNTFNAVYDAARSQEPISLDAADRQIVHAITHFKKTRKLIAGARSLGAKMKSVIHRATAPKETV